MADKQISSGIVSYKNFRAITPGPDVINPRLQLLYVGVAGDVTIENSNGQIVTVPAIAGWYPGEIKRITAATATGLVGYW